MTGSGADPSLYGGNGEFGDSEEAPRVVVRDKRRIDPLTGAVREPTPAPPAGPFGQPAGAPGQPASQMHPAMGDAVDLASQLAERTEDLQRVSAEYANYRRRVDRDRLLTSQLAQERLVLDLLPVLDDIDRAREHGDLSGAFKATADQLMSVLERAGVEPFGEVGDEFDPGAYEAVLHTVSPDISVPTCTHLMRRGYRRGDRILRPAMVGVAEPEMGAPSSAAPADASTPAHAAPEEASTETYEQR